MKKMVLYCLSLFLITAIFVGCSAKEDKSFDTDNWKDSLEKSQKVEAKNWNDTSTSISMTDDEEIGSFIKSLETDTWNQSEIPKKAKKETQYILYQEPTRHLGEGKTDQAELEEIAHIITYKDAPYIAIQIKDWTISFKVPDRVVEFLNEL